MSKKRPLKAVGKKRPPRRIAKPKKRAARPLAAGPSKTPLPVEEQPPAEVTRDLFLVWRFPRIGNANPQRLTNPVWSWLAIRRELNAWRANAHFDGPPSLAVGPGWCGNRFGQSLTPLPDGRAIAIGGEHEDHYDPDFHIYNDVQVIDPRLRGTVEIWGTVEIYGYPYEVFPPTAFHSATLLGDRILVVGCLGHPSQRVPERTPTFALETRSLAVSRVETTGAAPGWIFGHSAELSGDQRTLQVAGGKRVARGEGRLEPRENIDEWALDLERWQWSRLTDRRWLSWELTRADQAPNRLLTLEWMSWHVGGRSAFDREQLARLGKELGWLPDFALYGARYSPPIEHERVASDSSQLPLTVRIEVDGVPVRYVENLHSVRITVEGALPSDTIDTIIEDARAKLATLERSPYEVRALVTPR